MRFALILAAATILGAVLGARHFTKSHACADGPARRFGAWNTAMRGGVKARLGGVPWSANVVAGLETASASWESSYLAVCRAEGPHHAVRMQCLDRTLDRIRGLATSLAGTSDGRSMPDAPAGQPASLDAAARLAAPSAVAALPGAAYCETTTEPDDRQRPIEDPHASLVAAQRLLARGDLASAEQTIKAARDRAIGSFGDRHPELASYDDVLADADRARGRLRAALALHDQSEQLRTAAFGAEDASVATSLYHRALTLLEGGELGNAEHALHRALAIRTKVLGETSRELGELYAALAMCDSARGDHDGAHAHAAKAAQLDPATTTRPDLPVDPDAPAMLVAIASSRFAAGDHVKPAGSFATALAKLSNEPNRTALAAALALAQCDDPRAGQAARTAVQLYLAMPELDRAALPFARELASKP
ncbi:hypothetical protein BH11MYX1_BH11MYX1_12900 [soil metagenome]